MAYGTCILSRDQGLLWKVEHPAGSPLFREMERVLLTQNGIATLSDGTKVNTLKGEERLLGGQKMKQEIAQMFSKILEKSNSSELRSQVKEQALTACEEIRQQMQILMDEIQTTIGSLNQKIDGQEKALVQRTTDHSNASARLRRSEESLQRTEAQLRGLESREASLNAEIGQLNSQIGDLQRRIDAEEKKKKDALIDSIPVVGVFRAIVTGNPNHLPIISQIDAIVSTLRGDKERLENEKNGKEQERRNLQGEKEQTAALLGRERATIDALRQEINRLKGEIDNLDRQIKDLGRHITDLKQNNTGLKLIFDKYKFLNFDLNTIVDLVLSDIISVDLIDSFVSELKKIQGSFLAINYE